MDEIIEIWATGLGIQTVTNK